MHASLADRGLVLRHHRPGTQRAPCPACARSKFRQHDDALAVTIEPDGATVWLCHRCGCKGALPAPGSQRTHLATRSEGRAGAQKWRLTSGLELKSDARRAAPADALNAALAFWRKSRPLARGVAAARYLERRACALPNPEGDLRWHPAARHPSGQIGPALVALVTDAITAAPMTVHLTWVRPDGSGKADLDKPRLLWAGLPKKGGVVRLAPDPEITLGLAIAEGVETALALARAFTPAWACVDASNLAAFPLLDAIESLTIAADHDSAGRTAAQTCARRWADAGREVRIWCAETRGQDFADLAAGVAT